MTRPRSSSRAIAALIGVAAAVIFVGWPDIDLAAARLFYVGPRHFLFNHSPLATALRWGFRALTWGTAIAAVTGIILALARRRHLFGLGLPEWIFLALVLITGPGLIANTVLKDNWARPRPLHVTEFGGPEKFTPVLERSGACQRNCSFVSGEASATFALGFAFAMLARRRRAELMAAAVAAGSIAGLIRMGEGGHFLSDVVFAAVFMALDVALMYWLVFHVLARRTRDEAWWHEKTLAVIGRAPPQIGGRCRRRQILAQREIPRDIRSELRGEGSSRKGRRVALGNCRLSELES